MCYYNLAVTDKWQKISHNNARFEIIQITYSSYLRYLKKVIDKQRQLLYDNKVAVATNNDNLQQIHNTEYDNNLANIMKKVKKVVDKL